MKTFYGAIYTLLILFAASSFKAQVSVDELSFESQTSLSVYKPKNKNYAYIRSKKGSGGVNKNDKADSVAMLTITEIVLVFTEMDASAKAGRDEANKERWANLAMTYPEFFDYSPTLTNICQCNSSGDSTAFKKMQGFYIYFEGDETETAETPSEPPPAPVKEEKVAEKTKKEEAPVARKEESAKPKKETKVEEPVASGTKTEEKKESKKEKEPVTTQEEKEEIAEAPVKKTSPPKKTGLPKPRKAKDPKACRPPCYENGDEDLNAFFKDNITLTKKQKKKNKNLIAQVRIQLNFDGTIKNSNVTGANETLNQQVTDAIKRMNSWNAAVRNGLTVKSEVRMTLKYDKETKAMKPAEMIINPKPTPKCKCVSDAELFGD